MRADYAYLHGLIQVSENMSHPLLVAILADTSDLWQLQLGLAVVSLEAADLALVLPGDIFKGLDSTASNSRFVTSTDSRSHHNLILALELILFISSLTTV